MSASPSAAGPPAREAAWRRSPSPETAERWGAAAGSARHRPVPLPAPAPLRPPTSRWDQANARWDGARRRAPFRAGFAPETKKRRQGGPARRRFRRPEWALPLRLRDRVRSQAGDGGSWQGSAYGARGGSATHSREGRSGTPQCPRGSVLWLIPAAPAALIAGKERRVKFSRESYLPFFFFPLLFPRKSEATLHTSKALSFCG